MVGPSFSPVSLVPVTPDAQLPVNACRRLFILGCGRSGTSLVAGLFRRTGLFMGASSYLASNSNPTGYYEDREINSINEELVRSVLISSGITPPNDQCSKGWDYPSSDGQCWLARLSRSTLFKASDEINKRIDFVYSQGPTCLKDPRFNYTLQAWLSRIDKSESLSTAFICVFRQPSIVAASIIKEIHTAQYLKNFAISVRQAYEIWLLQYSYILEHHARQGRWLFIEYEDLLEPHGLELVQSFTGLKVDKALPTRRLNRTRPLNSPPSSVMQLYAELRSRAVSILD